jgi:hypothetical protein
LDQSGLAEDLEMVADGGLTLAEGFDELTHTHLTRGSVGQDAQHP